MVSKTSAESLMKDMNDFREKKLFSFKKEQIEKMVLHPAGAEAPTELLHSKNKWYFGDTHEPASTTEVNRLAAAVAALRTQEFTAPPREGAGLEEPSHVLSIIASLDGGHTMHKLEIGAEVRRVDEKAPKRFWARLDDRGELLQLADYSVKGLRKSREDLVDKRVFQVEADEIAALEYQYPDSGFKLQRDGAVWTVVSPEVIPEPVGVDGLIRTLADLPFKAKKPGVTASEARIDINITFTLVDGSKRVLALSEEVVEGGNYAQSPGHPRLGDQVFTVSRYKAANLLKKLTDLRSKR